MLTFIDVLTLQSPGRVICWIRFSCHIYHWSGFDIFRLRVPLCDKHIKSFWTAFNEFEDNLTINITKLNLVLNLPVSHVSNFCGEGSGDQYIRALWPTTLTAWLLLCKSERGNGIDYFFNILTSLSPISNITCICKMMSADVADSSIFS